MKKLKEREEEKEKIVATMLTVEELRDEIEQSNMSLEAKEVLNEVIEVVQDILETTVTCSGKLLKAFAAIQKHGKNPVDEEP